VGRIRTAGGAGSTAGRPRSRGGDVFEPDLERWLRQPVSRRNLLRGAGRGAMGMTALAAFLAACGGDDATPTPSADEPLPPKAGELTVAQWPLYIDRARGGHRPTLEAFEAKEKVDVDYKERIADNQAFFAQLVPFFRKGQDTGWDLVALSDWVVGLMRENGWVEPLHHDALPHVEQNLLPAFRNPNYDAGNSYSAPWQGGVTGIAYDPTKTGFEITRFEDLWDERLAGHVGMMTEMVDTVSLTMLMQGVEPKDATLDDVDKAVEKLIEQRDAGVVRKYYGQDYTEDMANGNTWATMAWSGDVFYYKYIGGSPNLEFVVPDEGGMLWVTPLEIPANAQHPTDAHLFMDWFYRPEIAAQVTDWVLYMTPVDGVQDIMREKAKHGDAATRTYYETLSESPMLFPPANPLDANLHEYHAYDTETFQEWAERFGTVVNA
jgi:spermidine/putrescine transport system substrate-binding protein